MELTIGFLGVGEVIPNLDDLKAPPLYRCLGKGFISMSSSSLAALFPDVLSSFLLFD